MPGHWAIGTLAQGQAVAFANSRVGMATRSTVVYSASPEAPNPVKSPESHNRAAFGYRLDIAARGSPTRKEKRDSGSGCPVIDPF